MKKFAVGERVRYNGNVRSRHGEYTIAENTPPCRPEAYTLEPGGYFNIEQTALEPVIDWTEPLELNDGTPLKYVETCEYHVGFLLYGAHACQPSSLRRIDVAKSDGRVISNHKYHVRNRIVTTKPLDTSKPLEFVCDDGQAFPVPFITLTSEGHILVGKPQGSTVDWMIFNAAGEIVRSSQPIRTAGRTLRNKPEKTCEYIAVTHGGQLRDGYRNRQLAWDSQPTANHLVQIDKENGVVVGVGVLKRSS